MSSVSLVSLVLASVTPLNLKLGDLAPSRSAVTMMADSDLEQAVLAKIAAMREAGVSDSEILNSIGSVDDLAAEPAPQRPPQPQPPQQEAPPPAPIRGDEQWGTWSNFRGAVYLEIFIDESVRSKFLRVEAAEGWLLAGEDVEDENAPPPMVFGRFAQPVEASELTWAVDENSDGQRVLCIELPKKEMAVQGGAGATVDCIFDESLHIHGKPYVVPGLSQGTITIQMPQDVKPVSPIRSPPEVACPCGDDDAIDAKAEES